MIEKYLNKVHCKDALTFCKKLPDNVIDCIITSPPYWGLRYYGLKPIIFGGNKNCEHLWGDKIDTTADMRYRAGKNSQVGNCLKKEIWKTDNKGSNFCQKCGAWKGQLGLEPTFNLFIDHLIEIFSECKRILKKEGTMWVNIGDTYGGSGNGSWNAPIEIRGKQYRKTINIDQEYLAPPRKLNAYQKCLCNIPSRFAIAMTDRLNLILRNEIIWYKPNCMPSSVTDRFTVDFEKIYFFTKSKKYYFTMQKVPYSNGTVQRITSSPGTGSGMSYGTDNKREAKLKQLPTELNPEGRNMRTVWKINSKPFKEAHFATFPPELVRRCLDAGCPQYVCKKCGKPRQEIYETKRPSDCNPSSKDHRNEGSGKMSHHRPLSEIYSAALRSERIFKGLSDCGCGIGFKNGIVYDPFMGAGTTALVALQNNINFIGTELNPDYIKISEQRIAQEKTQLKLPL